MYFEAAAAAIIIGLLLGGSVKRLAELRVNGLWLLIASLAVTLITRVPAAADALAGLGTPAAVTAAVLRYGFLIAFAAENLRSVPIDLIGTGGVLNAAAMLANSGRMPVEASALGAGGQHVALLRSGAIFNYTLAGADTRLYPICDIIRARGFSVYYLSVGDVLISFGVFALIISLMRPSRLHFRNNKAAKDVSATEDRTDAGHKDIP